MKLVYFVSYEHLLRLSKMVFQGLLILVFLGMGGYALYYLHEQFSWWQIVMRLSLAFCLLFVGGPFLFRHKVSKKE